MGFFLPASKIPVMFCETVHIVLKGHAVFRPQGEARRETGTVFRFCGPAKFLMSAYFKSR